LGCFFLQKKRIEDPDRNREDKEKGLGFGIGIKINDIRLTF